MSDPRNETSGDDFVPQAKHSIEPTFSPRVKLIAAVVGYILIVLLILAVLTTLVLWAIGQFSNSDSAASRTTVVSPEELERQAVESERERARDEQQRAAILAQARVKMLEYSQIAHDALGTAGQVETGLRNWKETIQELMTSDAGKRIAGDRDSVIVFRKLTTKERPSELEIATSRKKVEALISPIEIGLKEEVYTMPDAQTAVALKAERENLDNSLGEIEEDLRLVRSLTQATNASAQSLEEALKNLQRARDREQTAKIAAAEERARIEGDNRIAEERAEKIRSEKEIEARKTKLERLAGERAAKEAELEAEAKAPETQEILVSFITPGYWIPFQNKRSEKKIPMSWQTIQSRGCLGACKVFCVTLPGHVICYPKSGMRSSYRIAKWFRAGFQW